jgi:phosphoglycerate-specific signal transduction histidine kinase
VSEKQKKGMKMNEKREIEIVEKLAILRTEFDDLMKAPNTAENSNRRKEIRAEMSALKAALRNL